MTAPPELLIPPRDPAAAIEVVAATQVWLERAVIGLNLCPFAKAVHIKRQIRHAVTGARTHDELLAEVLGEQRLAALDRFDRVQLAEVVRCCRRARSLSAAGRELFAVTRQKRATTNDADRLRKYLARFGLDHSAVVE